METPIVFGPTQTGAAFELRSSEAELLFSLSNDNTLSIFTDKPHSTAPMIEVHLPNGWARKITFDQLAQAVRALEEMPGKQSHEPVR